MRILLQPAGDGHNLESTVSRKLLTEDILSLLPPDIQQEIGNMPRLELWGARTDKTTGEHRGVWGEMIPNEDWIGFIHEGKFVHVAQLVLTFSSPETADTIWGKAPDGRSWSDIYIMEGDNIPPVDYRPEIIGYKNLILRGPILLTPEKSAKLWKFLLEAFGEQPQAKEEAEIDEIANDPRLLDRTVDYDLNAIDGIIDRLLGRLPPSRRVITIQRLNGSGLEQCRESSNDTERIKEEAGGVCQLCGLPGAKGVNGKRRIAVHHIRQRSEGGRDEYGNYLAVCPTCHDMIHFCDMIEITKHIQAMERLMDDYPHTAETLKHLPSVSKRLGNARRASRAIGN